MDGNTEISLKEAVALGAVDPNFYGHYFFPRAFRQPSPSYGPEVWDVLENPNNRYISLQLFRGGSKTTILRTFTSRRIAYGLGHTILYIGKSQDHARRSVKWLRTQVKHNKRWSTAFNLSTGTPDTDESLQILHGIEEFPIHILALGITGSVRGVLEDEYRPDTIILDDVIDEENGATADQRRKISELIFGAVKESLTPASEDPNAMMVILQTPIDRDDASEMTQNDEEWASLKIGCFDEKGESRWPERWSTETLQAERAAALRRNQRSLWLREKECVVVADEKRYFREGWLEYWDILPPGMVTAIGIDPSPPKDEDPEKRKKKDPDPEVVSVVGIYRGKVYLLEYAVIHEPNPSHTWAEVYRLGRKYNVTRIGVETVAYQKTLEWYIKREMQQNQWFKPVKSIDDKRSKVKRIRQTFLEYAPDGNLLIRPEHTTFKEQFRDFPDVTHEDVLDSVEIAIRTVMDYDDETDDDLEGYAANEEDYKMLENWRACP